MTHVRALEPGGAWRRLWGLNGWWWHLPEQRGWRQDRTQPVETPCRAGAGPGELAGPPLPFERREAVDLPSGSQDGIEPMWEDARNKRGGRWLVSLAKQQRHTELDRLWLETVSGGAGREGPPREGAGLEGYLWQQWSQGWQVQSRCHSWRVSSPPLRP